jgi:hypothetical protein
MEILGNASTKVTSVCHESARPPPLEASSSNSLVPVGEGTVGCATVRPKRAPKAWCAASSRCVLAAEEQHLVRHQRGVELRDCFLRQVGRKLQVLHLAADVAGDAADAQVAEAGVDG